MTNMQLSTGTELVEATLIELNENCSEATVLLTDHSTAVVRIATDRRRLQIDDLVLLAASGGVARYLIGTIESGPQQHRECIDSSCDGHTRVIKPVESERIQINCDQQAVVVEYDAVRRQTRVSVDHGDLEIAVPAGDLKLCAKQKVQLMGESVECIGLSQASMTVLDPAQGRRHGVQIDRDRMQLDCRTIELKSIHLTACSKQSQWQSDSTVIRSDQLDLQGEKYESKFKQTVQKADCQFEYIEGLSQQIVGRARTISQSSYHLMTEQCSIRSNGDVKIDGKQIHLG